VVEDEYFVALDAQQFLEEAGFVVVGIAETAAEALDIAVREKPEIAVMDVRLKGERDGVDAALDLRSALNLPCVFATAHTDPSIRKRAETAKPLGWLQKPYSAGALIDMLNSALRTSRDTN
jgi:DNA-binding NarL/FixJ family response regulator